MIHNFKYSDGRRIVVTKLPVRNNVEYEDRGVLRNVPENVLIPELSGETEFTNSVVVIKIKIHI